jgi:hypothetical protein
MYHFIKGLEDRQRVPGREVVEGDKAFVVVEARPVIDYARARIEDESRTLNAPQSVLTWGDNDDFPVLRQAKR